MLYHRRAICGVDGEAKLSTEKSSCLEYGGSGIESMLNAAFGVLLPFLPLFLRHQGLSPAEIGAIYGTGFALSCFMATVWYYLDQIHGKRKWIWIVSVSSWIIFVVPFAFAKEHFSLFKFKSQLPSNNENNNKNNLSSNYSVDMFLQGYDVTVDFSFDWEKKYFVVLFMILTIGKIFQAPTDFFTFDHECLLRLNKMPAGISFSKASTMWAMLRSKGPQSLLAITIGYLLDNIDQKNSTFGNYKLCFYVYAFLLIVTIICLNMTDIQIPADKTPPFPTSVEWKQLLKPQFLILVWIIICLGVCRGFFASFLCLHFRHSGATHMTIASAFAMSKASEFFFHIASVRMIRNLCSFELFFIILVANGVRALLLSWFTSPHLVPYVLLPELLGGLTNCLLPALSLYFAEQASELTLVLPSKIMHFFFWGLGMKAGSVIGGCLIIQIGSIAALRSLAIVSLWTGIIFILISLDIKSRDDTRFKQLVRRRSAIETSEDYFLQNVPLLER